MQIATYLTPRDVSRLEEALRLKIEFVIIDPRPTSAPFALLPNLSSLYEIGALTAHLTRPDWLAQVVPRRFGHSNLVVVDEVLSPVVAFTLSGHESHKLSEGRVYAKTTYFDEYSHARTKPIEFVAWLKSLLAECKRRLEYMPEMRAYVGKEASANLHNGE